jgi:hypothetical protein
VRRPHRTEEHLNQVVDEAIIREDAFLSAQVELTGAIGGCSSDEDDAEMLPDSPQVSWSPRASFP